MQWADQAATSNLRTELSAHLLQLEECGWQPIIFRPRLEDERGSLRDLLRSTTTPIRVFDTLLHQIHDLILARNPGRKFSNEEAEGLTKTYLNGTDPDEAGAWVYYPWSGRLVHLLEEQDFAELRTNRNRHKITADEQATLATRRVGVVGLSVGQSVALALALERSLGELRLADFDRIDLSNLNRIRTGVHNLQVPKTCVVAREIAEIDPYLQVKVFDQGITCDNVDAFLLGNGKLDVLVEECDSLDIKTLIRELARSHRIPVVMDTSDRGMLDIERFDQEPTRPIFHGLVGDLEHRKLSGLTTEQKIPYVLQILSAENISTRMRASLIEIGESIVTWPQLASDVLQGGAIAADAVRRLCLGEPLRSGRYYVDLSATYGNDSTLSMGAVSSPNPQIKGILQWQDMIAKAGVLRNSTPSNGIDIGTDVIRDLVSDAAWAPSGGNCQPWKWLADSGGLYLFHDLSLSQTPFDPCSLGGLVALGASTENLVLSSHHAGLEVACDLFPNDEEPNCVARFTFGVNGGLLAEQHWRDELYPMIRLRRTNRKICARRPLDPCDLEALSESIRSVKGANVSWLWKADELENLGALVGGCDRLLFTTESFHRFLVNEIRWTPEQRDATRDGVSLDTLELSASDEAGLKVCRDWEALQLVRRVRGGRSLEKPGRKAIMSASAVGLVTMPSRSLASYFLGGRAVERAWLTATERSIALHPMTALPYLIGQPLEGAVASEDSAESLVVLRRRYKELFAVPDDQASVFLFRVSYADQTEARSLRRPLETVLYELESGLR